MVKYIILIINIIIGYLVGRFIAIAVGLQAYLNPRCYSIEGEFACMIGQIITGFVLSLPVMIIMWIETKKINDKSILFFGAPVISISAALSFSAAMGLENMSKETPYILLAFILFYSFIQVVMYVTQEESS